MPDRRKHRGPHPEDVRLFDAAHLPTFRAAAADFCWLLNRGYPHDSSLKLVGDRYDLVARQRTAVSRCCCSDVDAARRQAHQVAAERMAGVSLWVDGYNVLTTIEAALAGGVILAGVDGAYRDMASMHGSYRKVAETLPALELLGRTISACGVAECRWLLDQPVSNSGRLKRVIEGTAATHGWPWRVELVPNPDRLLANPLLGAANEMSPQPPLQSTVAVATADSAILDRCPAWFNLARETIARHIPDAWVVRCDIMTLGETNLSK
jgi:hypothetical protein